MESEDKVRIIDFPCIRDARGNLTFVQDNDQVPFEIHRAFWLYDVPAGSARGGHSHKTLKQCLVSLAGSFTVTVTDGKDSQRFLLNRPFRGLYIPPGYWSVIDDFAAGSVCLTLASQPFNEDDYIRDYDLFLKSKQ